MKSVLRDLLSPERLRRAWSTEEPPGAAPPPPPLAAPLALVAELRARAREELPAADGLHTMIDLLEQKVAAREELVGAGAPPPPEAGAAIAALASRIGDVIDALTVGGQRRGGSA